MADSMKRTNGLGKQFNIWELISAKRAAIPVEHGSWVFLLVPLVIGYALGGLRLESGLLFIAVMAAFLARTPLTLFVKAISRRRPKTDIAPAVFWMAIFGIVGLISSVGLALSGFTFVFYLVVPAIPVLIWHLWLVSRRAERRQSLVEVIACGSLAMAAPAAYWVGINRYDPAGWLIWALCWAHASGTILYAYLRLEQRKWTVTPSQVTVIQSAIPALLYNIVLLIAVVVLALINIVPGLLPFAYLIQPLETIWGTFRPAIGVKPTSVGIRQMVVSILFTIAFIVFWKISS